VEVILIHLTFHTRKGHPFVWGNNDNRVVQFTPIIEKIQHPVQLCVKPLRLECIVENITSDDVRIRPIFRNL
jgi:hypothetical protein